MVESVNYRRTKLACYLGFVTQAISANFVPLLFFDILQDLWDFAYKACVYILYFLSDTAFNAVFHDLRNRALEDPNLPVGHYPALQYLQFCDLSHKARC